MNQLRKEFRYALRSLLRVPGFSAIAIATLALGIGANTAIVSVVNGVVLKPLPNPNPQRLVFITSQFTGMGFDQFWVSAPEFLEFRERNRSFSEVGAYVTSAVNIGASGQPQRVASGVSGSLFGAFGVRPRMGGRSPPTRRCLTRCEPSIKHAR